MTHKILVVEDNEEISNIVSQYLKKEGHEVHIAPNGFEALEIFSKKVFHLVLLDIMMPGISGYEVLKELRTTSDVPVIMLTAKEQEVDRLKGFDYGADDYVVKPFSPRELVKRVSAIFKRVYKDKEEEILSLDCLHLHLNSMKFYKNQEEIELTSTEFLILKVFLNNQGIVLTRERLIQLAFGYDYEGLDRSVDTYIKRIRAKIEDDTKNPKYLKTRYGMGYIFGSDIK
ncbi:MAG: response regulator transcription factor [Fusobacteriaceae bacterium]|nr:response regulator transcription factor [Fusobacteriaceae bacterium]MBN2839192.1 response regulator transcription factor [Fusobacteriaceae bacterium]